MDSTGYYDDTFLTGCFIDSDYQYLHVPTATTGCDVACIQEPPALLGQVFNDMIVVFCSNNLEVDTAARDYTRAAVLIRREITIKKVKPKPDCVSTDITTKDGECLRVVSLYADKNLDPGDLCSCLEGLLEDREFDYSLVAGDLNACSSWWCSPPLSDNDERTRRGEVFEDCFLRMNLAPVNANKGVPSFYSGGRSSYIDAILAYGVTVNKPAYALDTSGDHRTLMCEVRCGNRELETRSERINYVKVVNWDGFKARVANKTPRFIRMDDIPSIEQAAVKLNDVIREAMLESCKDTKNKKQARERRKGGQVWWNNELEKKRKTLRREEKEMRKTKREGLTEGERESLRNRVRIAKRDYFNSIHRVKREFYQHKRSTATFKELTRSFKVSTITTEGYEAEKIIDRLLDIGDESLYSHPSRYEKQSTEPLGGDVTLEEIRKAASNFKKGKAPGSDEIAYEFIQIACGIERWVEKFRVLIQRILEFAFYPSCLKEAKLILLPKVGQQNIQEEHKRWRPISLLKSMAKIVEAVLRNRIMKFAEIPPYIHGYVNNRSTVTALRSLSDEVLDVRGGDKVLILYDLSAAFDKISQRYIIKTFKKRTNRRWSELIHSYLVGHTSTLDGVKRTRSLGVPQGSCTGPVCFMLSTVELGELLSVPNPRFKRKVAIYADDIAVSLEASTVEDLIYAIEDTDKIIGAWAEKTNMQVNKRKNEIFVRDITLKNNLEEKLIEQGKNETADILKHTVKWLGVHWAKTWTVHVTHMMSKATKTVAMCRGFWQKKWGGSIDTAVAVWNQVVCPQALYGIEVYGEVLNYRWLINKYERLQASFMRTIYGLIRSTPTKLLSWFLSAMTEPLWNRAAERCAKRWLHCPEVSIGKKERRCLTKWGISMSVDREITRDLGQNPRNLHIEIGEGKPCMETSITRRRAIYFTDGSLSSRGYIGARVACGIVRITNVEGIAVVPESYQYRGYRLPDHSSIMQAEQCGILEAMRWFNSENAGQLKEVVINVDSTSAIKVLVREKGTELTGRDNDSPMLV
ncbi:hypothetical protein FOZ60_002065 [Perkinsus olseni]|uniref:Reverse transcriptase domain-containing protein n=2 Tax=Perkinsus olseni TaxID=32597 RepID=A0A7J6NZ08_PEROL|nr:hypothetical protein FOZ60_002065 [Perkinsus olseni]